MRRELSIWGSVLPVCGVSFMIVAPSAGADPRSMGVANATGELTLHGVTKAVTPPIEARLSGDVVTVTGSLDIAFADYGIEQPTSFLVLSIEDHGVMELHVHFRRG